MRQRRWDSGFREEFRREDVADKKVRWFGENITETTQIYQRALLDFITTPLVSSGSYEVERCPAVDLSTRRAFFVAVDSKACDDWTECSATLVELYCEQPSNQDFSI